MYLNHIFIFEIYFICKETQQIQEKTIILYFLADVRNNINYWWECAKWKSQKETNKQTFFSLNMIKFEILPLNVI